MIPVGDSVQARTFPYVNLTIIAANVAVFLYQVTLSTLPDQPLVPLAGAPLISELDRLFFEWGTLPACLSERFGFGAEASGVPPEALPLLCEVNNEVESVFTSMFMHGGWVHLIGNMIFLWVFGDNVEDAMGHTRYAVFYLVAGMTATAAHVGVNQHDVIPAIGASGAIAGVLGAYLVVYPRATITAVLPILLLVWFPFYIPAVLLIGLWFLLQVFNGVAAIATTEVVGAGGGVAWFAHIGGFVAGVVLVKAFLLGRPKPPPANLRRLRRMRW